MTFQEQLDQVSADLQEEAEYVLRALRGTLNALRQGDVELAEEVVNFDDQIDARNVAIEQEIESLFATQAPVASDLRLVIATLHVNRALERIGDNCVTIAKVVTVVADLEGDELLLEVFEEMGVRAEEMIRVAMGAFAARDVARAESLAALDEMIDRVNRRGVNSVLDLMGDAAKREWGLRVLLIFRCLERIGDQAVDIGEQTAYVVTAQHRDFSDESHNR